MQLTGARLVNPAAGHRRPRRRAATDTGTGTGTRTDTGTGTGTGTAGPTTRASRLTLELASEADGAHCPKINLALSSGPAPRRRGQDGKHMGLLGALTRRLWIMQGARGSPQ